MKNILITICAIVAFMLANSTNSIAQDNSVKTDTTITVKVKGIHCGNDCNKISENVISKKGVKECKLVGKPSAVTKFEITYNKKNIKYNDIVAAIEDTGGCSSQAKKPYKVKKKK